MQLPTVVQRIEAGIIFAAALYFYLVSGYDWKWFALLLFSIDVSMAGYLFNNRVGAYLYNLGHSFTVSALLLVLGSLLASNLTVAFGIIWVAHIGLDRALGFGLKLESGFKDTHLGRI